MPSAGPGSCRRLRTLVAQVATPSSTAVRSFAGSELDPVSGLSAGMTITDIKPWVPTARPTLFFYQSMDQCSLLVQRVILWQICDLATGVCSDCAGVDQERVKCISWEQVSNLAGA
jgi:hypothetical protein